MKFLCSNCKAKYQIADEKVEGRTLRMTCRRCQEEIVIRGEPPPPAAPLAAPRIAAPAPVPSPLGADFQMQLAQPALQPPRLPPQPVEEWHVAINDVPVGPIRREDVARRMAAGAIDLDSLAWSEGMDDWQPIRMIPQLARLSGRPTGMSAPPPPPSPVMMQPPMMQPAMMQPAHPAMTGYGGDPWAAASSAQERSSQVVVNPLLQMGGAPPRALPSWPVMFALAGGFAFLMSGLAIFGASWLRGTPQPVAAPASAGPAVAPPPAQPALELPAEGPPGQAEDTANADDQAGSERSGGRPRATTGGAQPKPSGAGTNKKLTEAQKAMLARMGGDTGTDLAKLGSGASAGAARPRATGTLSSDDVSRVVLPRKKNLQRCYETAMRGANADDTVRMDVEFTVTAAGNVINVRTSGNGLPGMAECIERTVKMWRFPESSDSSPVSFPVLFQPGA